MLGTLPSTRLSPRTIFHAGVGAAVVLNEMWLRSGENLQLIFFPGTIDGFRCGSAWLAGEQKRSFIFCSQVKESCGKLLMEAAVGGLRSFFCTPR